MPSKEKEEEKKRKEEEEKNKKKAGICLARLIKNIEDLVGKLDLTV